MVYLDAEAVEVGVNQEKWNKAKVFLVWLRENVKLGELIDY